MMQYEVDLRVEALKEMIAERYEKAAESQMIAQAHRDAGHDEAARGWELGRDNALAHARTIEALAVLAISDFPTPAPQAAHTTEG